MNKKYAALFTASALLLTSLSAAENFPRRSSIMMDGIARTERSVPRRMPSQHPVQPPHLPVRR